MILTDFHTHTTFCDGKNTPKEMIESAITLGLSAIGLTCHAFTPFDTSYCIKQENVKAFTDEIARLKTEYADKIKVYCGVEFDYYADMDLTGFDYAIGSVHYIRKGKEYFPVDEDAETILSATNKYYNGDIYLLLNDYFATLADMFARVKPAFIGHFDLISKFNVNGTLFDENNPRYISVYQACVDKLIENGAIFEINFGAISRGYKKEPYPSKAQIEYIKSKGGKFILSSDAHDVKNIAFGFIVAYSLISETDLTKIF